MAYQQNPQGYDPHDEDSYGIPGMRPRQQDSNEFDDDRNACMGESPQDDRRWKKNRYTIPGEYRDDTAGQADTRGHLGHTVAILVIGILLYFALSVEIPRTPRVTVSNPILNQTQPFTLRDGKLSFNVGVNVTVDNPNYFSIDLKRVELNFIYPVKNYPVGGGFKQKINLGPNAETNFTFPLSLDFNVFNTSGVAVLYDIMTKCRADKDLTIDYKLKLKFSSKMIPISSTISDSLTFGCPSELGNMLSGLLGSMVFGGILGSLLLFCLPGSSIFGGIIGSMLFGYFLKR